MYSYELENAVKNNDLELVQELLAGGADVNQVDHYNGITPLHIAAYEGHIKIARLLIENGAEVNHAGANGDTSLHCAAFEGHIEVLKLLINNGADVDKADCNSKTPLHIATANGHIDVVAFLIKKAADMNLADRHNRTPIQYAAFEGHDEIARLFIENGVDVNQVDAYGNTSLHWAAQEKHIEIAQLLIENGADVRQAADSGELLRATAAKGDIKFLKFLIENCADVNQANYNGKTPLHVAAENGHIEIVKFLIENGADMNQADLYFTKPLRIAVENGHDEVAKLLIENGAAVNYGDLYIIAAEKGHIEVLKLFIENGADVNQVDTYYGGTSLHYAAEKGNIEVVKFLIKNGADVNLADRYRRRPLYNAAENGHLEIVELLIENGANVNKASQALSAAARNAHIEMAKFLIENGADVNKARQALSAAARNAHIEMAKLLIENGADVNKARQALSAAAEKGHIEMAKFLIENGADVRQAAGSGQLLRATAAKGDIEFLGLLIKHGADVNQTDLNAKTLLRIAAENGHVEVVALLLEICVEQEGEVANALELIFQKLESEAVCQRLLNLLCSEGNSKKALYFLYGLERSQNIDDTVKETFYTEFAGEIFFQYASETLSPDNFTDFLLELTNSETIERVPDAFLKAYLDNLLGFLFNFDKESQQFERIFYSIPMLKLALHLKDPVHINKSLQIILLRREQDFDNRDALPQIENCETILFECDQTLELCASMRSLWDPQGLCYEKIIQWARDVYNISQGEALSACLMAFRALDETDSHLAAIETALNENPYNGNITNDDLIHFLKVFRILFNQHQTWYQDTWHYAAEKGNIEIIKFLIENGANVRQATSSGKLLHIAAVNGHIEIVRLLIENNADVNLADRDGNSPLQAAAENGYVEIARLLIENGSDVRQAADSDTLLRATAAKGDIEFLGLLIDNGADVSLADRYGNTPLRIAAENRHVEIVALLVEICFEQEDEIVSVLECVFQQPEPELRAIYGCLMNYLCEGHLNKVLRFLDDLELSTAIDDTVKESFYTAFSGEIFAQYFEGTLPQDNFTDFLLELTKSETIERVPNAFLQAYLNNLLEGFIFNFEEFQQFERIFYSIPMLKLALHLKDSVHINKSLQIILLRTEQDFHNRDALPQIENCELIVFECDQTLELCASMRSLWDPQGLCYEKIIQWACDVYNISQGEALAACLTAFRELDENDRNLAAIEAALNELPVNENTIDDELVHFFKVFRILFSQHQTWYYDNWHELAEKIRIIINDTRFFDSNIGVFKQIKNRAYEIERLADFIFNSNIDLDNTNPDEIRILLSGLSELSAEILNEIEVNQSSETQKRTSGLFKQPKPSKLQVERVREFLRLLIDPDITPRVLLENLNEFHGIDMTASVSNRR